MPRLRDRPLVEQWLRAKSARTDPRQRAALILRGPAFGVPLFVPRRLLPCSRCLILRPFTQFRRFKAAGKNLRIEPVCDECYPRSAENEQ